jgi:2-polyprenyl-3-methyl-5-hydroxy-6-metoxy-1,4-benzoquinol methylase
VRKAIRKYRVVLPGNASVLDAGSGFGQYTWRMVKKNPGWHISGVDINSADADDCNDFFGKTGLSDRVNFSQGDLTDLTEKNCFDFILTVDVMEHIQDDEKVFRNFYNSLKEKGLLIISTPSDQGGSDVHSDSDSSFIDEHVRDGYGKEEIERKLKDSGFSKIMVNFTYGRTGQISWAISMKYPVRMLNISYLFFIILPFYYIIFYPVAFILNIIDVNTVHKSGTGLLVVAEK